MHTREFTCAFVRNLATAANKAPMVAEYVYLGPAVTVAVEPDPQPKPKPTLLAELQTIQQEAEAENMKRLVALLDEQIRAKVCEGFSLFTISFGENRWISGDLKGCDILKAFLVEYPEMASCFTWRTSGWEMEVNIKAAK